MLFTWTLFSFCILFNLDQLFVMGLCKINLSRSSNFKYMPLITDNSHTAIYPDMFNVIKLKTNQTIHLACPKNGAINNGFRFDPSINFLKAV